MWRGDSHPTPDPDAPGGRVSPGRRIAVIGAGWAGCAAAAALHRTGCRVTLFESAREPGGRARAVTLDGRRLDNGQHILLGAYAECLRLMREVGVDPDETLVRLPLQLCYPAGTGMQLVANRLPAPLHLAAALFRARGLDSSDKMSLLRFFSSMRWMDWQLDRDCTVEAFLEAHGQTERLYRLLWRPLCLAALNTGPSHASARVFLAVLRDSLGARRAASDMLIPKTDLGALLPQAMEKFLSHGGSSLRAGARVGQLARRQDGTWRVVVAGCEGDESFDGAVLATPALETARLLAGHADIPALATFLYEAIATIYLQVDPAFRLPRPFLALLDAPTHGQWGQFVFDRGQLDDRQAGLLAVVVSAAHEALAGGREALGESVSRQLAIAFDHPSLLRPAWTKVIVEKRATFSCRPDLNRPDNDIGVPGLWLAGDYTAGAYPATLEGAVRSGLRAARLALASLANG